MQTSIYVNYFNDSSIIESEILKPIHLGAKLSDYRLDMIRDDQGDHISERNPYYCELTGLYWAWKNDTDSEYLGFFHYRRLFDFNTEEDRTTDNNGLLYYHSLDRYFYEKYKLNDSTINELTDRYDAIIPVTFKIQSDETVKSQYINAPYHHKEDLDLVRAIIKDQTPDYLYDFDKLMQNNEFHPNNMFILRRDIFDNLCCWVFGILDELHEKLDYYKYQHFQEARTVGYIAERLVSVFFNKEIVTNPKIKYIELNRVFLRDTTTLPNEPSLPDTKKPVVSLAISSDKNYIPHLSALIASIASNMSDTHHLEIIILNDGFNDVHKKLLNKLLNLKKDFSIHYLNMQGCYNSVKMHSFFTKATLFRLILPEILTQRDKILFLDTDMIVTEDLTDLYNTNIDNYYLAAAPDLVMRAFVNMEIQAHKEIFEGSAGQYLIEYLGLHDTTQYFQAGTLLLNLKKLREDNMPGKMLDDIHNRRYWFLDQDILNRHLADNFLPIDNRYNTIEMPESHSKNLKADEIKLYTRSINESIIIHYAGITKPWLNDEHSCNHYYWYYLRFTAWYETIMFGYLQSKAPRYPVDSNTASADTRDTRTPWRKIYTRSRKLKRRAFKALGL